MPSETLQERIGRGAVWLDKAKPGWAAMIDMSILNPGWTDCVLGQVFGTCWTDDLYKMGVPLPPGYEAGAGMFNYGFCGEDNWVALWKAEITSRLEAEERKDDRGFEKRTTRRTTLSSSVREVV